jgi:ferredoxin/flavodoxin---NADP+ reductase
MYTVKYLLKHGVGRISRVDIFERLTTPFGLVRFGVAPDHVEVKEVSKEFSSIISDHSDIVRVHKGVSISSSDHLSKLQESYHATIISTGAQGASRLPLNPLPSNTMSARDFVLWYNGHPDKSDIALPDLPRNVSIVGHGNVALDAARMLSKSVDELYPMRKSALLSKPAFDWFVKRQEQPGPLSVSIFGRRGYMEAAFTNKEFRELTTMRDATCKVSAGELGYTVEQLKSMSIGDRAKSRGLSILQKCIDSYSDESKKNSIFVRFFAKPIRYIGEPVSELVVERHGIEETVPT